MTNSEYKAIMKEAVKEFNDWLKENKRSRLRVKKAATKIRMATLKTRATAAKAAKKKVVKKKAVKKKAVKKVIKKKVTKKVARKKK
jgi:hypothetical protein